MVHELIKQHSVFNQFIKEIRDESIQKDRMRFRRNLERAGEILAYEISKTFDYVTEEVTTSLGVAEVNVPATSPLICSIMRAGLPMHQGFLNYFDAADSGFIAAYRKHHKGGNFEIEVDYISCPNIEDRTVILVDPMLATGASIEMVYKELLTKGKPAHVHIASLIATDTGIRHVKSKLPQNITVWVGAIDKELTAQSYIVPGLGDAGDLAYGGKS
ncbi:MAG TPA: uracil phosphoribosyltransferase [Flavobacteriales bacterium]